MSVTVEVATLCEGFQRTAARVPDRVAIRRADGAVQLTWGQYAEAVRAVAAGLHALGLRRGDRLAMLLPTGPAFFVLDTAALHLGAVPFSMYATAAAEQIEFLLAEATPRMVVTDAEGAQRITGRARSHVEHVIVLDNEGSYRPVAAAGEGSPLDLDAAWQQVAPDDLATIIYTSGTTGPPKAVQITHRNVLACARGVDGVIGFPDGTRVVSYLPMAHNAERNNSHWFAQLFGFTVTVAPDARTVANLLPSVRPTWFFGVPRVFEKMKAALEASADAEESAAIRAAVEHLLDPGRPPADPEVIARLRRRTGLDEARAVNVGAAPAVHEMLRFFHALGIPLSELWGMSELAGAGTINPVGAVKLGTCGPPIEGIELRIAEDGELQARGEALTPGYRGRPDLTREAMTADGWLRTGDLGAIDEDGYLSIVGRKKELIINAGGKNMSPALIEGHVKGESLLIGHVVAIGDRRPYNVALILLDPDGARAFAGDHEIGDATLAELAELAEHPAVVQEVAAAVERANARLSRVERIKRFHILPEQWQPGTLELTPTMKIRRREIGEKYAAVVDAIYAG